MEPERSALQTFIDETQRTVNGEVRLKLYKGNALDHRARSQTDTLYRPDIATFEDDRARTTSATRRASSA